MAATESATTLMTQKLSLDDERSLSNVWLDQASRSRTSGQLARADHTTCRSSDKSGIGFIALKGSG